MTYRPAPPCRYAPPDRSVSWALAQAPSEVRRARRLTRSLLARWGLPERADTAELLVSELVTNALQHGRGPVGLSVFASLDRVHFQIADADPLPLRPRAAKEADLDGRGLHLVDQLALGWGTRHTPVGKIVWFDLPA